MRNLHLYLITHTGFGIAPIVGSNKATRSGRRNDCCADVICSDAKLAGKHSVYVNAYCWIAKRLFELDIAQLPRQARRLVVLRPRYADR